MSDRSSGKTVATQSRAGLTLPEGKPGAVPENHDRLARLVRTIEGEIVPRLLLSYSGSLAAACRKPDRDRVLDLVQRLGELWDRDECDLGQLLASLSRLESAILELNDDAGSGR